MNIIRISETLTPQRSFSIYWKQFILKRRIRDKIKSKQVLANRQKKELFSSSFLPCFFVSAKLTKANKLFLYQQAKRGKQLGPCYFFSLNGAPIHPALIGNSRGTKKNGRNLNRDHQFTLQVRTALPMTQGASLRQYIGAGISVLYIPLSFYLHSLISLRFSHFSIFISVAICMQTKIIQKG